jgi:carbon-monoxide dehydrogenase medium subunit|tara:strand:- start:9951 stop:10826 length:876 start_codon:yes stop_codon:yes gene_type:complete
VLPFEFLEPQTLADAIAMLGDHDDDACVFGGGTALLLAMRQRMIAANVVVSLGALDQLRGVTFSPGQGLRIGAMTCHAEIARAEPVHAHYPVLAQLFSGLANPQVRNQGTVGGNVCYADPATDPQSCLIALGANVIIAGPDGERRLPMREFVVDFFTTALEPGEILTQIIVPPPSPQTVGHYRRLLRTPAEHRPVANVSLVVTERSNAWDAVSLVIGAAVPVAQTMYRAEAFLCGRPLSLDLAEEAAQIVAEDLNPVSDGRGDAAFRTQIVRAATRRIIAEAAGLDWSKAS